MSSSRRDSGTPANRNPTSAELNRYMQDLRDSQATPSVPFQFVATPWPEGREMGATFTNEPPPLLAETPHPSDYRDTREETPPRIMDKEEPRPVLPGNPATDPLSILVKELALQRQASENNITSLIQALQQNQTTRAARGGFRGGSRGVRTPPPPTSA